MHTKNSWHWLCDEDDNGVDEKKAGKEKKRKKSRSSSSETEPLAVDEAELALIK